MDNGTNNFFEQMDAIMNVGVFNPERIDERLDENVLEPKPTISVRAGRFTASEIYRLMTNNRKGDDFGAPGLSYIEEKRYERKLGRSINTYGSSGKAAAWGNILEPMVAERIIKEYDQSANYQSSDTLPLEGYEDYIAGTPDLLGDGIVYDIKCPFTLLSFCQLVDGYTADDADNINPWERIRAKHKDGDKYYWQLVLNSIITNRDYISLAVYMPYFEDLPKIRNIADGNPEGYFINFAENKELPYLISEAEYKDLNFIRYKVPQEDKEALMRRIDMAIERLESTI